MKRLIEWILSVLFPPKLPRVEAVPIVKLFDPAIDPLVEDGVVSPARPKRYRDGIERYFATVSACAIIGLLALVGQVSVAPGPKPVAIHATALQPRQLEYEVAREVAARVLVANGCSDTYADPVGRAAVDHGMNPQIIAGIVFVESSCNPLAVSDKGAVGLLQVNSHTWRHSQRELRDPYTNAEIGTKILADYVNAHGLRDGLHRYNGLGDDGSYGARVLYAAYRR
jgi:hypothetical protein